MKRYCSYGEHTFDTEIDGQCYGYIDKSHGINDPGVSICARHLIAHLDRYYPASKVAKHIHSYNFPHEPRQMTLPETS